MKLGAVGAKIFNNFHIFFCTLTNLQNFVYYSVVILNHISALREQGYMNVELSS